jgi:choline dehydrogenase-like flavoprotein
LLAGHRVEALTRADERTLGSVVVVDGEGVRRELVTREVVVCAGAADSVLFCQRFARELGLEGHPRLGTRLHDHFSIPLFNVEAAGHPGFTDAYAPGFAGAFIVGRRLELEVGSASGWNPAGFLHFQCQFDHASPYREVKALLELRQRGGEVREYVKSAVGMFGALPSSLKVGFNRYFRKKLYITRDVGIVATFDFESFPSPHNRLALRTDGSGAEGAEFDWDLRGEDLDAFRSFYPRLKGAMESLARRYSLSFEPVESLAENSPEEHLIRCATDAYHLGGGVQAAVSSTDGILRPDLRLHTVRNVHMVSGAVFRRPGIANPVHTLLALANRLSAQLGG